MALSIDRQMEELNDLIRFDRDAIGAYDEAIQAIHHTELRDRLVHFRGDHERHITELSAVVLRLGGQPVDRPDFKGAVRKTLTKIAGLVGTETVLRAMKSNEELINRTYSRHAAMDFPRDVLDLVQRNFQDEQHHLAWIDQALRTRLWEQAPVHP